MPEFITSSLRALHGGWIVGLDLAPFLYEGLHQEDRGRFANVVCATLEGEAEDSQMLSAQRPERAADFSAGSAASALR